MVPNLEAEGAKKSCDIDDCILLQMVIMSSTGATRVIVEQSSGVITSQYKVE